MMVAPAHASHIHPLLSKKKAILPLYKVFLWKKKYIYISIQPGNSDSIPHLNGHWPRPPRHISAVSKLHGIAEEPSFKDKGKVWDETVWDGMGWDGMGGGTQVLHLVLVTMNMTGCKITITGIIADQRVLVHAGFGIGFGLGLCNT